MPKLILMTGPTTTRQVALGASETSVGRASTNDIVLDQERVSRFHAVFAVEGPFTSIKDLQSRNGVFVNGSKVQSQILVNGDNIAIGDCQMRFLASDQDFTAIEALRLMTVPGLLIDLDRRAEASKPAAASTTPLSR